MAEARRMALMGSLFAFLSVAIGAFGAHALKARLEANAMQGVFETGVHYQMFHSVGLLLLASFSGTLVAVDKVERIGVCFMVGITLFSGSLYALAISGIKVLGAITPFGGVAFMVGWVLLAIAVVKGGKISV